MLFHLGVVFIEVVQGHKFLYFVTWQPVMHVGCDYSKEIN